MSCRAPRPNPHADPMVGIRFLDEPAAPTPPSPTPAGKVGNPPDAPGPAPVPRRQRERPIGLISFLAVVAAGVAVKLGGGTLPLPTTVEQSFGRSFVVDSSPQVVVETFDGPIEIIRGEPGRVDCRVEARCRGLGQAGAEANLARMGVSIVQEGNRIRISIAPGPGARVRKSSASVTVIVPEDASIRLATSHGRIKVQGIEGPVQARSSNGEIDVRGARGIVSLESRNGRISCQADQAIVALESSNGSIEFNGSLAPGLSALKTNNGRITLRLPDDQVFHLDAHSNNGRVSSDFDDLEAAHRAVMIRDDSNAPTPGIVVKARSGNGSIRVLSSGIALSHP
ncbi:hypothetical protein BH23PLA1_BH23PLA1_19370 [soil metagenome]